jgi:hypothetical protein
MINYAGPGGFAEIDANVEPCALAATRQSLAMRHQTPKFHDFIIA